MSIKYTATSDQKSLMCFMNGKPSSETSLLIQKSKAIFHFRPSPGSVNLCSAESLLRDLVWKKKKSWRDKSCSWVIVNKQLPHSAAGLGGGVGVIPVGTRGCYIPPGMAATSCAWVAGPEVCWSGCSEGRCSPRLRGRVGSYRPWSRWRWDCAPGEPRRFCTASWTWTSGSGTRSLPEEGVCTLVVV